MMTLREAAERRVAGVAAPADRPSHRRCAEDAGSRALVRASVRDLEIRAKADAPDTLEFTGYASVTERAYEMWDMFGPYTEVVSADAFDATLARADLDVPLVLNHDSLRRIARTTNDTLHLSMDSTGLLVRADLDPTDADVAYIAPKIRSGLIDEMSFKFGIDAGQWSPDYDEFRINAVDIHRGDVSIVGYGANPYTAGSSLRAALKPGSEVVHLDDLAAYRAL
jgi:uncharacterized protein